MERERADEKGVQRMKRTDASGEDNLQQLLCMRERERQSSWSVDEWLNDNNHEAVSDYAVLTC